MGTPTIVAAVDPLPDAPVPDGGGVGIVAAPVLETVADAVPEAEGPVETADPEPAPEGDGVGVKPQGAAAAVTPVPYNLQMSNWRAHLRQAS